MGIDHVGRKGPSGPPTGIDAPASSQRRSDPFPTLRSASAASPASAPGGSALERFRAGQIGLDAYLDAKVGEATSHLSGLPADRVAAIREALREQLASDPALADLVRTVQSASALGVHEE
jgi:hypothetical protein